jgi:hypothetical protein
MAGLGVGEAVEPGADEDAGCAASGAGGTGSAFGVLADDAAAVAAGLAGVGTAAVVVGFSGFAGAVIPCCLVAGVSGAIGTPLPTAAAAAIAEPISGSAARVGPAQPAIAAHPVTAIAATCSPFRDSGMADTPRPVLGVYAFLMLHRAISEKGE